MISRSFSLRRELDGPRAGQEFRVEVRFGEAEVSELEHARTRPLLYAQRIEVGDQMAAVRVDLHQPRDRALLGGGIRRQRRGARQHAGLVRPLHDSGLDRRMNLFTRAAVLELLKVFAPLRIDALRIASETARTGLRQTERYRPRAASRPATREG